MSTPGEVRALLAKLCEPPAVGRDRRRGPAGGAVMGINRGVIGYGARACWGFGGHRLDPDSLHLPLAGRVLDSGPSGRLRPSLWGKLHLDALWCPGNGMPSPLRSHGLPFSTHPADPTPVKVWWLSVRQAPITLLALWDTTGDRRLNSNAVFITCGHHSFTEARGLIEGAYPTWVADIESQQGGMYSWEGEGGVNHGLVCRGGVKVLTGKDFPDAPWGAL